MDSAMHALEQVKEDGGWTKIYSNNRIIEQGDSGKTVVLIRRRLMKQGIITEGDEAKFDEGLKNAILKFQCLHGLKADGKVGSATMKELNVSVDDRLSMLRNNQSTIKKLIAAHHERLVLINVPAFMVHVFDHDSMVFSSKVVVGKYNTRTAEFGAEMNAVVLNPYWDIPNSILRKEILPEIRKDPDYLERNHMEWQGKRLRQRPGPDNALGMIKFLFPNPFNMYLHDTPSKELFSRENRAFSHGCIRIEDPMRLAVFALVGTPWNNAELIYTELMNTKEKSIPLERKIWVEVTYLTAFVDGQGNLNFRRDLYQKRLNQGKNPKKN